MARVFSECPKSAPPTLVASDRFCVVRTGQSKRDRTRKKIPTGPVADYATRAVPHHVRVSVAEVTTHRIIRALAFLFSYRRKGSKDFRLHQAIRPRPASGLEPCAPTAPAAPLLRDKDTQHPIFQERWTEAPSRPHPILVCLV